MELTKEQMQKIFDKIKENKQQYDAGLRYSITTAWISSCSRCNGDLIKATSIYIIRNNFKVFLYGVHEIKQVHYGVSFRKHHTELTVRSDNFKILSTELLLTDMEITKVLESAFNDDTLDLDDLLN